MDEAKKVLIVFTRYPVAGRTKTRLVPALGEKGAAALQRQMTEYTLCQARMTGVPVEVWYTGGTGAQMCEWLGDDLRYVDQGAGGSGERIERAFQSAFAEGARHVVLTGTDCPSNRAENMKAAFEALEKSDVVLGPSVDGGYYLLGLRSYVLQLIMFEDIDWGSAGVLNHTLSSAAGVRSNRLPCLCNIDVPEDIPPVISVVIPTLNAADHIGPVLARVLDCFGVELIVVDGGSEDDTVAYADAAGARVVETSPGRAHQMNAGAGVAIGKILLFLYPDTLLPKDWDMTIRRALSGDVAMGAFSFSVDERLPGIGLIEWGVKMRSHVFARPGGDQGFFMKHETFEKLGGFPDQPLMEDYAMVRRMRKLGRIAILNETVVNSAGLWKKRGVLRTFLLNRFTLFLYRCHFPPDRLRKFYKQPPGR